MLIKYKDWSPKTEALDLIDHSNAIIHEYQANGYDLSLRQLYYRLVTKNLIENTEKSYKRLGTIITKARDAGMVDWSVIVDRTRSSIKQSAWNSPKDIISSASQQYRMDKWVNQDYRISVWVEKDALAGVVERACFEQGIETSYLACKGYMSASAIWAEAQKLRTYHYAGQYPIIIHLGDLDPSGIDMTRDNIERLEQYSKLTEEVNFNVIRIALNYDQVEEYNPPPNPAKLKDTRAKAYIAKYGFDSWELDALEPDILVSLIQAEIEKYKDHDVWAVMVEKEEEGKIVLEKIAENYKEVAEWLGE